jgi:hypothetical protein
MGEKEMSFLKDTNARVPFAVIGIFLIILSTLISLNIARLDINMAKAISSGGEITAPDTTLQYAKADLARAVNYAGLAALKTLGETPVVVPDNTSVYYEGTGGNPAEFNKNWAKAMIQNTLDLYIESNYMTDTFVNNEIAVNVDNIGSWREITIEPVRMRLEDRFDPPLFKPGEGKYRGGYETYYKVAVPLRIHVRNLKTSTEMMDQNITIETIITSRYPLLKDLTTEYGERLNGTNAVMTETTAFAMAYTWGRGYMQYYDNTPDNIVNNTHLALIMNGALLLDQGYVFKSVDPMSLAEYAKQTALTLSGRNTDYRNISLDNGSLKVDPRQDAFNSTNDSIRAKAEYYNATKIDYNATPVMKYLNNESRPGGSIVYNKIKEIISRVYGTKLATGVARQTSETQGSHSGYEESYSIEPWGEPDSMTKTGIIAKDSSVPGNLYGETWVLAWTRNHVWRHTYYVTVSCGKGCTTTVPRYNYMTAVDSRVDNVAITLKALENSNIDIYFDFSRLRHNSKNDVYGTYDPKEVTYRFTYNDPNLEPAYVDYRPVFDANKIANLKNIGLNGDTDLKSYTVDAPKWVAGESQFAVDDITGDIIRDIHLDPAINYENYPVPSELLIAARDDLIRKVAANETRYANKSNYYSGKYYSASGKAISVVREWYVDQVMYQIWDKFSRGSDEINRKIKQNFSEDVKDANRNATKFLSGGMNLPLGLRMMAYHVDKNGTAYAADELEAWNESVTLSINQEPNYLDALSPHPSNPRLYTLKVRNNNILGAYGVNVLPTLDPWLTTFNMWSIDVEGEFVKFEVQDIDNEVHPDPIFGHSAQVYVRRELPVEDPLNNNVPIGDNLPIKFSFTTGTFIAVPPGKLTGVGDKDWVIIEESPGWKI